MKKEHEQRMSKGTVWRSKQLQLEDHYDYIVILLKLYSLSQRTTVFLLQLDSSPDSTMVLNKMIGYNGLNRDRSKLIQINSREFLYRYPYLYRLMGGNGLKHRYIVNRAGAYPVGGRRGSLPPRKDGKG